MTLVILAHHFLVRLRQRLMACATTPALLAQVREGAMTDLSGDRNGDVRPLTAPWSPLAVLPLSLRAVRFLLRVALPQPTLDLPAALGWLAYHQQR
jgi:hypothetical protein